MKLRRYDLLAISFLTPAALLSGPEPIQAGTYYSGVQNKCCNNLTRVPIDMDGDGHSDFFCGDAASNVLASYNVGPTAGRFAGTAPDAALYASSEWNPTDVTKWAAGRTFVWIPAPSGGNEFVFVRFPCDNGTCHGWIRYTILEGDYTIVDWHSDTSGDRDHAGTTTLVELTAFTATPGPYKTLLSWETAAEIDPAGFHIWRSENRDWGYERITEALIPAEGSPTLGASYTFEDKTATPGRTYCYKLEDLDTAGNRVYHPVVVSAWPGVVNIRVNDQDGPVSVPAGEAVRVTALANPGFSAAPPKEWWLCCHTPFGWFSCLRPGEWTAGIQPAANAPTDAEKALEVLHMTLPPGGYTFYLATDRTADNSPIPEWLDSVEVTVE